MATQTQGPRKTFKAGADLSSSQYLIVKVSAANTVVLASSATDRGMVGVLQNAPKQNEGADVAMRHGGGTMLVKAGGNISLNDALTSDAAGRAVATTTANDEVLGVALEAGVDGQIIEIRPCSHRYAIT